jgi:hypothetical protein
MSFVKSILSAFVALSLFAAHTSAVFAANEVPNSRLERLQMRQAKMRSRVVRNSRATTFGIGTRSMGGETIRSSRSKRSKTIREYKIGIRRPSLRQLHRDPVSRSRIERTKSADAYEERLKRGLVVCGQRYRSRYDRNNCIRKITRGTRTFEQ